MNEQKKPLVEVSEDPDFNASRFGSGGEVIVIPAVQPGFKRVTTLNGRHEVTSPAPASGRSESRTFTIVVSDTKIG